MSMKGKTESDLFTELNVLMGTMRLKWDKLLGDTSNGCQSITGQNVGFLKRMENKVTEIYPDQTSIFLHCILHQDVLSKCVLKHNHVISNFYPGMGIESQTQFVSLLDEHETEQREIGYHSPHAIRWLFLGKVLKKFEI